MQSVKIFGILVTILLLTFQLTAQNIYSEKSATGVSVPRIPIRTFSAVSAGHSFSTTAGQSYNQPFSAQRGWSIVDQINFDMYLEAGHHFSVYFDAAQTMLDSINPAYSYHLTTAALQAIDKAPAWLRNDLRWVFSNLSQDYQNIWAGAINDAQDPYIDEVAFSVAHSSFAYLTDNYGTPGLFEENAETLYDHDQYLDYVQIVDYGSSATDSNYYSTTRYYTISNGDTVEREVPKEIYYWYLVHPKITDEIPAYIDPDAVEDNSTHNNNIADPPTGKFWRDFLFSYHDEGYPSLKDTLLGCKILWDGTQTLDQDNNSAIEIVTNWIDSSLVFDSDDERPHQPVRIYRKHKGRCGEHADISAAAARAALIPCTSIFSYSTDHTWNAFWDNRWVQWEPVNHYVDKPLVYENGWGKVFGVVFEIRSDGYVTSVTDEYSEGTATINVHVTDANNNPVDGAEVYFYIKDFDYPILWNDFYTLTDNAGNCSVVVGDDRDYYLKIRTAIGDYPESSGSYLQVATPTVAGETYNESVQVSGNMPELSWTQIDTPAAEGTHYKMVASLSTPEQILFGPVWMDDVNNSKTGKNIDGGWVDVFMTDEANYNYYVNNEPFEAFNIFEDTENLDKTFLVPQSGNWYWVVSNDRNLNNPQHISGNVTLYSDKTSALESKGQTPQVYALAQNYPNPFNPVTTIRYCLARTGPVTLTVFDVNGRKIKTLVQAVQPVGLHSVRWNGRDDRGKSLASGVYLYRLKVRDKILTKKMILLK
jgi:hypothetical protein